MVLLTYLSDANEYIKHSFKETGGKGREEGGKGHVEGMIGKCGKKTSHAKLFTKMV